MTTANPVEYLTREVPWSYFASLTFKNERRGGVCGLVRRREIMFTFLRELPPILKTRHWKDALWMARHEHGEMTGRPHYHALLGCGAGKPSIQACFRLMRLWRSSGGGHARVRLFCPSLRGVAYVLKGSAQSEGKGLARALRDRGGSAAGANAYELAKFGETEDVFYSPRLVADIAKARAATT